MPRVIFSGANLVDGVHPAQSGMSVVVAGDRIESVGPDASVRADAADRVVDLAGRSLMPGMFQCHFHTCFSDWGAGQAPQLGLEKAPPMVTLFARDAVEKALASGFTSLVCSSSAYNIDYLLKQAMVMGLFVGPRMMPCSRELMTPGDQPDGMNRFYYLGLENQGMVRHASGPEEFRRAVREELGRGAEIVKVAASHGHGTGPAEDLESVSIEELRMVARTAHAKGKKARAHSGSKSSILACAEAGIDLIDHADRVDAECIEAIVAAGSTVAPTPLFAHRYIALMQTMVQEGEHFAFSTFAETREEHAYRVNGARADLDNIRAMLPEMDRAGIPIVVGDDYGTAIMPHGSYADELEFYVKEVGIDALDVIRWATKNGADFMGTGDELGTVEAGKLADLVIVDGDPTREITCLKDKQNLHAILLGGDFVKDELDRARTGS